MHEHISTLNFAHMLLSAAAATTNTPLPTKTTMESSQKVSHSPIFEAGQRGGPGESVRSLRGLLVSELSGKGLPAASKLVSIIENAIRPAAGDGISKAPKLFAIPELLEHILSFCDGKDLLVLRRLNRATKSTTETSTVLRRKMMIEPQLNSFFATPFETVAAMQDSPVSR